MTTAKASLARPRKRWSTLKLLKAMRLSICLASTLLLFAVIGTTEAHRIAFRTVSRDTVPSIMAAQHIKSAIADMDADAARELLFPSDASAALLQAYEDRRVEASQALITAAGNITYGDAERLPIQSLQLGLGTYERLVQKARDLRSSGSAGAAAAYREAFGVVDGVLLPAADALDQANSEVLQKADKSEQSLSSIFRWLLAFFGLTTLGTLVTTQIVLSRRMHRTFNLPLLAATLAALLFALLAVHDVAGYTSALETASGKAFTSTHALWQARAAAYAASSAESRYLLDLSHSPAYDQAFAEDSAQIAAVPADLNDAQLVAALRDGRHVEGFSGYLASELSRPGFPGEREAALRTLAGWQRYVALDSQLRRLERSGQHQKALMFYAGLHPGQVTWTFQQFDVALGGTLAIDEAGFEHAVETGGAAVNHLEAEAVAEFTLVGLLTFIGFAPRLREYR